MTAPPTARRDVATHMAAQAEMFSGFSEVAAADPRHSWFPTAHTPAAMADATSAGNRMVSFPHTTHMCCRRRVHMMMP
jgi:acetyl-CoA C-acetyltransferase